MSVLEELQSCATCHWRYETGPKGLTGPEFLAQPLNEPSSGVCQICLGTLDMPFLRRLSQDLVQKFDEFDTHVLNFAINLSLCVLVRDCCAEKKIYATGETPRKISVKEAVKILVSLLTKQNPVSNASLVFTLTFQHEQDDADEACLRHFSPGFARSASRKRAMAGSGPNLANVVEKLGKLKPKTLEKLSEQLWQNRVSEPASCDMKISREALHFGGRYNKYSRELSQSSNFNVTLSDDCPSVAEFIGGPLKDAAKGDDIRFCASGREDIDVRMLGDGRPFVLSVECPRKTIFKPTEVAELEQIINSKSMDVFVRELQLVQSADLKVLKEGEDQKRKHYSALCWSPYLIQQPLAVQKLNQLTTDKPLVIQQQTPLRVLQRRSLFTRAKSIYSLQALHLDEYRFMLYAITEAGTYVKEFVHGDMGRTEPCLADLIGVRNLDILELDVEKIELDWPPSSGGE